MSENQTLIAQSLRERVAEEIRVVLARRMMSASELGRRVGMTQPYISRRLTGETAFDIDDLAKIADALGVDVADLLPRSGEGRLVATARDGDTSRGKINVRKATSTGRTRPIGGPLNQIPRQATRRPARLPLALTGS